MRRLWKIACITLPLLSAHASADEVVQGRPGPQFQSCTRVTIKKLSNNPGNYQGKRVCIAGYLRKMIPYGEDSAALVAEKKDAVWRSSAAMINVSVPLTMWTQEKLARYSGERLRAVGIFRFDRRVYSQDSFTLLDATLSR
jgi:hypothetical protein